MRTILLVIYDCVSAIQVFGGYYFLLLFFSSLYLSFVSVFLWSDMFLSVAGHVGAVGTCRAATLTITPFLSRLIYWNKRLSSWRGSPRVVFQFHLWTVGAAEGLEVTRVKPCCMWPQCWEKVRRAPQFPWETLTYLIPFFSVFYGRGNLLASLLTYIKKIYINTYYFEWLNC